jgi:hypothetical protein
VLARRPARSTVRQRRRAIADASVGYAGDRARVWNALRIRRHSESARCIPRDVVTVVARHSTRLVVLQLRTARPCHPMLRDVEDVAPARDARSDGEVAERAFQRRDHRVAGRALGHARLAVSQRTRALAQSCELRQPGWRDFTRHGLALADGEVPLLARRFTRECVPRQACRGATFTVREGSIAIAHTGVARRQPHIARVGRAHREL